MEWRKVNSWYEAVDADGGVYRIEPYGKRFRVAACPMVLGMYGQIDTLRELQTSIAISQERVAELRAKS